MCYYKRELLIKFFAALLCGGLLCWLQMRHAEQADLVPRPHAMWLLGGLLGGVFCGGRIGPAGWCILVGSVLGAFVGKLFTSNPDPNPFVDFPNPKSVAAYTWADPLVEQSALCGQGLGWVIGLIALIREHRHRPPAGDAPHATT